MSVTIDFTKIRGVTVEGQRSSFEQLVCHLARLDGDRRGFQRVEGSGGDGGVEALRTLPTGRKTGYQAKYYPSRDQIDWNKLDNSVKTALTQHPQLERYVIALPCDFTGKRAVRGGSTEGIWGEWDARVQRWETLASSQGMSVEFEPWTAFELQSALLRPAAQHLIRYFFDTRAFTREWMQRHLDRTFRDLHARYSPGEHVDTESLMSFDVIFRRENVRRDLHAVFESARRSDPRAAVALVNGANIADPEIVAAESALSKFLNLSSAVDCHAVTPWPLCEWVTSWYFATRKIMDLDHALWTRIGTEEEAQQEALHRRVSQLTNANELISPQVFAGRWSEVLPIDASRAALFVGRAGAGKSHALARGTENAWNSGIPVIHVLGQHIVDDDPRASILKRLEIADWSFHDALSALNLAAETSRTRAMLVIDALNEGRGTDVWRYHLASFVREVTDHDRIVLVMSCREEYLDYIVFPQELIASPRPYPGHDGRPPEDCAPHGKLVRVAVDGFRTIEEREAALRKFMDDKGIARPTAPVLDSEFFNPLFLSSVCQLLVAADYFSSDTTATYQTTGTVAWTDRGGKHENISLGSAQAGEHALRLPVRLKNTCVVAHFSAAFFRVPQVIPNHAADDVDGGGKGLKRCHVRPDLEPAERRVLICGRIVVKVDVNLCARHRSEFSQFCPQRSPSDGDHRGYAFHAKQHCRRIIAGLEGTRCPKLIVAGEHRAIGADDKGGIPRCAVTTMSHADHHRDAVLASSPLESFERTFRDRSLRMLRRARGTYQYHWKGATHSLAKLPDNSKRIWAPRWIGISSTPHSQRSAQIIALQGIPSIRNTPGIAARWLS